MLNRDPPLSFSSCLLIEVQDVFGVLRPDEHPSIVEDWSGLLLVSVDVVDMSRRRFDRPGSTTGDSGGEYRLRSSSHIRHFMSVVQSVAEMISLGLGSHVKPTDDERKEVCPHSGNRVTCVSRDSDESVEVHEGVHDGERKSHQHPDNVHCHGDGPLPSALGSLREDLPVSVILGQDDQGWEERPGDVERERDVLEGGNGLKDVGLVRVPEIQQLT